MIYGCTKCKKPVHRITLSDDKKDWLCDDCYWGPDIQDLIPCQKEKSNKRE